MSMFLNTPFVQDRWTADVTSHRHNLAAEQARWEALENRNTELEMSLSELQRQYQWKMTDFQILERQNELETKVYREERERWMTERKSLEGHLAEKEKLLHRKTAVLLAQQKSVSDSEDEKKQLHKKLDEMKTENKLLQMQLHQSTDRGAKHRHRQRSRASSVTEPTFSSVESGVSMSTSVSGWNYRTAWWMCTARLPVLLDSF